MFDRPQHLEQLIVYGADLDARTANLDTPLHICALNNHEACLRLLLKHGASRDLLNASGQTASEVAMLTGLTWLAEIIDTFRDDQIDSNNMNVLDAGGTDSRNGPCLVDSIWKSDCLFSSTELLSTVPQLSGLFQFIPVEF
ncbi:unnamed protein product [Echinostoma caproni]|uniref:Uncharacterized protein n=1 Tax=Echinostoma caproni TaxID=27848 RepID=A0A3P8L9P4_9TREM|nr:unnamed protein product [Echinostoma caproni]